MKRICLLLAIIVASCGAEAAPRKNVLFVVSDDLNCYLGAYGDPLAKTPNMDRLAAQGTVFTQAMCQFPVCGPSRASFMTGLRPNTTGIVENGPSVFKQNPGVKSIPAIFKKQGYVTGRCGKVYNAVDNSEATDWDVIIDMPSDRKKAKMAEGEVVDGGHVHWRSEWRMPDWPDEKLPDGANAAKVVEWLGEPKEKPFFFAVGFKKPHQPLMAPKKYFDMHDKAALAKRWTWYKNETLPDIALSLTGKKIESAITEDQRAGYTWAYYATISYVDAQLGKLLDALKQNGLADDTIVVLFGDNGFHLGEHRSWGKNMVFEPAARVPLIISAPGSRKGQRCDQVVELVDLFPTLLELCGMDSMPTLEGRSLVPALHGEYLTKAAGFTQVAYGWSVRSERWRLMSVDPKNPKLLLYDLKNDPKELVNQAENPEWAAVIKALQREARSEGLE